MPVKPLDFLQISNKSPVEPWKEFFKQYRLSFIFAAAALVLLIFGVLLSGWLLNLRTKQSGVVVLEGSSDIDRGEENKGDEKEIVVDVSGAVINPGVYTLAWESRLKDALVAAGGLSLEADRSWVGLKLNLAAKIIDGAKIYIPSKDEVGDESWTVDNEASGKGMTVGNEGLININTASSRQLESLAGIGPATAAKIIDGRPYAAVEDLLTQKILGAKTFEKLKDKLTVY